MMMPHPTKIKSLILLIFVVFFQLSCEKDTDLLLEAVLIPEDPAEIENTTGAETSQDSLVSKTIELNAINDAYIQEGKGFDENIIRVRSSDRTSYLMFDLSTIKGELENIELKLTIDTDPGDGTLKIYKASHSDWSEDKLYTSTAPQKDTELGAISKVYNQGATENIKINKNLLTNELISFVITQETGNDFSITSKENPNSNGPKLIVTYKSSEEGAATSPKDPQGNQTDAGNTVLSADITSLKAKFDDEWARALPYYTDQTSGPETSGQRRYYDMRVIDGLIYMLQATGDLEYVDKLVWYVDRIKNEAKISTYHNDGYYDWEVPIDGKPIALQLYDAHGLRNIFKFLYLAEKHPVIKSRLTTAKYNDWLPWFTKNLWDKWKSRGNGDIMRGNTHMASHMASNMALYLYLLEKNSSKKAEYLSWINAFNDNVDSKRNWGGATGTGFRDQLRVERGGYVWAGPWGSYGNSNDITHTNAEVQAIINQYKHNIGGWNAGDIDLFGNTLSNLLNDSKETDYSDIPFYINGTTNNQQVKTVAYGWAMLGQFNANLQEKLKTLSVSKTKSSYYYNIFMGIMIFNEAELQGKVVFPE